MHRMKSRNGRRPHYAHQPGSRADIQSCFESAVHMRAKDLMADTIGKTLVLPLWHDTTVCFTPAHGESEREVATPKGNRRPDVLLTNSNGQQFCIEVNYSHPKSSDDVAAFQSAGVPVVELSVSPDDSAVSQDALLNRLADSDWLVPPKEPFYQETPPCTGISESYLKKRRVISDTFTTTGFRWTGVCWEKQVGELLAWICDEERALHGCGDEKSALPCDCRIDQELHIRYQTEWVMDVQHLWRCAADALKAVNSIVGRVETALATPYVGHVSEWTMEGWERQGRKWFNSNVCQGYRATLSLNLLKEWQFILERPSDPPRTAFTLHRRARRPPRQTAFTLFGRGNYESKNKAWQEAERWASVLKAVR